MSARFDVVAFDADDTLWHCEDGFRSAEERFVQLLSPFAPHGVDVMAALTASERAYLPVYGYGVKAFGLASIDAAVNVSGGKVPAHVVSALLDVTRDLMLAPVKLLDGVPEVLDELRGRHRLVLITKGDLIHQTRKITTSGLEHHFEHVEIVLEKDATTYAKILRDLRVHAANFCMVGNSLKSDCMPVLALGGHAVHIAYPLLWELEHIDQRPADDDDFAELASISELPGWLRRHSAPSD